MVRSYEQVGTIGGNQWSLTQQKTYTKKVMNGIDQQKQAPIKDMCVGGEAVIHECKNIVTISANFIELSQS